MQLRETRFASFSSYRGARQICMQAYDFSRYSRKKRNRLYRFPGIRWFLYISNNALCCFSFLQHTLVYSHFFQLS